MPVEEPKTTSKDEVREKKEGENDQGACGGILGLCSV